jgi:hypothetical protein
VDGWCDGFNGIMTKALRWIGAVTATAVAVAVCVALGQLAYQFFEIYGADRGVGIWNTEIVLNALPFVLPSALVVAAAATAAFALAGRPVRRPRFLALAGLSLVLTSAIVVVGAFTGTQAKQRGQEVAAAACSADERQVLQALGTVPTDGEYGTGMTDGSCSGYIAFVADADANTRLDAVRAKLTDEGWVAATSPGEPRTTYRKGGQNLEVTVVRNKVVEVTLSFV